MDTFIELTRLEDGTTFAVNLRYLVAVSTREDVSYVSIHTGRGFEAMAVKEKYLEIKWKLRDAREKT